MLAYETVVLRQHTEAEATIKKIAIYVFFVLHCFLGQNNEAKILNQNRL